jgi:hypothetical protein
MTLILSQTALRRLIGLQLLMIMNRTLMEAGLAIFKYCALCYKPEGRWFDSCWGSWIFQLTLFFQPHYGPGVDLASNRNEY